MQPPPAQGPRTTVVCRPATIPFDRPSRNRPKESPSLTPEFVILALKGAVVAVTILLGISLAALALGQYRLHGRINLVFFMLVLAALLGFELVAQVMYPGMLREFLRQNDAL